jgi:hypothetical protein
MFLGIVVIYLDRGYKLNIESNSIYDRNEDYCIYVKVNKFSERIRYVFEIRFVQSREKALQLSSELYRNLKSFLISKDIPIYYKNKGFGPYINEESYYPAITTETGKNNPQCYSLELVGKMFDDEVIGYNVYELITPIDDFRLLTHEIKMEIGIEFNKTVVAESKQRNDKELIALEIYNLSNSNWDVRVSFVLAITAIEVLVGEVEYKPDNYITLIKQINKRVLKKNYIIEKVSGDIKETDEIINYVKNSVGMLARQSVLEKCKELIQEKFDNSEFFEGESALEFFNTCYDLRSKFIHAGNYDYRQLDDRKLRLKELCKRILDLT